MPEAVRAAGWNFIYRGERFSPPGQAATLVIGVAAWNQSELNALGELLSAKSRVVNIWVFDIDDFEKVEELRLVLPGVTPPIQTPVVAEYFNGDLGRTLEGAEALEFLTTWAE